MLVCQSSVLNGHSQILSWEPSGLDAKWVGCGRLWAKSLKDWQEHLFPASWIIPRGFVKISDQTVLVGCMSSFILVTPAIKITNKMSNLAKLFSSSVLLILQLNLMKSTGDLKKERLLTLNCDGKILPNTKNVCVNLPSMAWTDPRSRSADQTVTIMRIIIQDSECICFFMVLSILMQLHFTRPRWPLMVWL